MRTFPTQNVKWPTIKSLKSGNLSICKRMRESEMFFFRFIFSFKKYFRFGNNNAPVCMLVEGNGKIRKSSLRSINVKYLKNKNFKLRRGKVTPVVFEILH